jgi:hypothetical protein
LAIGAVLLGKAQVYRNPLDSRLIIGKIYGLTLKKAEGRRQKAEGRRQKAEGGRRKKEEGRRKKEEGRRKKEEGRRKKEEGRRKREGSQLERYSNTKSALIAPFPNPVFFSPAPLSSLKLRP